MGEGALGKQKIFPRDPLRIRWFKYEQALRGLFTVGTSTARRSFG